MIPTAQVLCDILNDPTVPSEAKVSDGYNWRANPDGSLSCNASHGATVGISSAEVNAWLFWSLSAWLWERGVYVRMVRTSVDWLAEWPGQGCGVFFPPARSPVEALAAVVREVNAASPSSSAPA